MKTGSKTKIQTKPFPMNQFFKKMTIDHSPSSHQKQFQRFVKDLQHVKPPPKHDNSQILSYLINESFKKGLKIEPKQLLSQKSKAQAQAQFTYTPKRSKKGTKSANRSFNTITCQQTRNAPTLQPKESPYLTIKTDHGMTQKLKRSRQEKELVGKSQTINKKSYIFDRKNSLKASNYSTLTSKRNSIKPKNQSLLNSSFQHTPTNVKLSEKFCRKTMIKNSQIKEKKKPRRKTVTSKP